MQAVGKKLSGARKAAILMVLLGEEAASTIYRNLSDSEVQIITRELTEVGGVQPEAAQDILEEYHQLAVTQDYLNQGGVQYASQVLINAFGEPAAQALLEKVVRAQEMSVSKLDSLQKADPQQLAKFLEGEHPQTIALILAHFDAKQASSLLLKLPEQIRADVVKRLAHLRQFSPEMAEKVSVVLNQRLQGLGDQSRRTYAGFKSVADLMNRLDSTTATTILEGIETQEPKLAISIRNLMFTFDDLLSVPEISIRELMGKVDKKLLTMALKGASDELKDHIFRTMSNRAVEMLKEDMEALGPVRSKDVAKAQQEVVTIARQLEAEGKIVLRSEGEDEYVV